MRTVKLSDEPIKNHEEYIFNASDLVSRTSYGVFNKIAESNLSIQEKIQKILRLQSQAKQVIKESDEKGILKNYFSPDGGIILTQQDVDDIIGSMFLKSCEEGISKIQDEQINGFFHMLGDDFCYMRGDTLNFRNHNYYFLFGSLKINQENIARNSSVNDYEIQDVDLDQFEKDITTQYHRVDQYLKLFLDFFLGMSAHSIMEKFGAFYSECEHILDEERLNHIQKAIYKTNISDDEKFNEKILNENLHLFGLLKEFKKILGVIKKRRSHLDSVDQYHDIIHMIQFLTVNGQGITQIKNAFGVDINAILRKYTYNEVPQGIKKFILGLLDAKINILAHMQNMTQLLFNQNLLRPGFEGDLILKQDQVTHMNKLIPEKMKDFKGWQEKISSEFPTNREIAIELDANIGYFCDILVGDHPESYLYATSLVHYDVREFHEGYIDDEIEMFTPAFRLMGNFLDLIETYGEKLDEPKLQKQFNDRERNKRRAEQGKLPKEVTSFIPKSNKNYTDAKSALLRKVIRLHREENHPLVIIKTAQNAYNKIMYEGHKPTDALHILSVNYGGSTLAYYAKHVFQKLQGNGRILANIGNIVYSIYDVKNANDFLSIVDYPFNEYIKEFDTENMKAFLKQRNHLIIFDDNTTSGRTLHALRELGEKMEIYSKVDIFACRASEKEDLYDASIDDATILNFIMYAATQPRKTKVGPRKRGYKEVVGTYIGNTLYKTHFKYLKK